MKTTILSLTHLVFSFAVLILAIASQDALYLFCYTGGLLMMYFMLREKRKNKLDY